MLQPITNVVKLYQLIRKGRSLKMSSVPYSVDEVIRLFNFYDIKIIQRRNHKNQDFLNRINKLPVDAAQFIKDKLNPGDCVRSLLVDRDYPKNFLYVFKTMYAGQKCYIKLTIDDKRKRIIVISFHEDEVKKDEKN